MTANALMIDPIVIPIEETGKKVKETGAEFFDNISFGGSEAADRANGWVDKHTNGRIRKLFDALPAETGLLALNALYFKDRWKNPFDRAKTQDAPFRLAGGGTASTKLMHSGNGFYFFRADDKFIAVDLPFATPEYALLLVTSKGDPLRVPDFEPASAWLTGEAFEPSMGSVAFPRLAFSAGLDLKPALNMLGLEDKGLTEFSRQELQIGAAQQRVELTVDEEGAEAAAATGIAASRSLNSDFMQFVADKPFLFALRNTNNGLILAAGYVAKP